MATEFGDPLVEGSDNLDDWTTGSSDDCADTDMRESDESGSHSLPPDDIADSYSEKANSYDGHGVNSDSLFEGSPLGTVQACILIFQYVLKHHLSSKAFSELLLLLGVLLPATAKLPKSIYMFKKLFISMFPTVNVVEHYYCRHCHMLAGSENINPVCQCSEFDRFVSVPIAPQLTELIKDRAVYSYLKECLNWRNTNSIRDVYDGAQYRKYQYFLNKSPTHLSLILNTDGVAIFRSSKYSVWPVWFVINELPKNQRFLRKNMLLGGMWYSKEKPTMTTFLRPILDEINTLYKKGLDIITPEGLLTLRCILLMTALDLPARAIVFNMKQFNAKFGCLFCYNEGTSRATNPLHRFWPGADVCQRTHQSMIENSQEACSSNMPVKGVKGPSVLCLHHPFDLARGCVIDNLHTLYLGVTLHHLKLWFGKAYKQDIFSIYNKLVQCDRRLLSICVPDEISRVPRTLSDYMHWKGSELQNWALHFSLPVLHGILPLTYLQHWSMLVSALHILSSDSISPGDFQTAETLLKKFYVDFPRLYGEQRCTMNVHLLSHLPQCVKAWGPVWGYSCFPFESRNADIKRIFHGSWDMSKQMAFSYVWTQVIPRRITKHQSVAVQNVQNVLLGRKSMKKQPLKCGFVVGKITRSDNTFYRYQTELGRVYYSANYGRVKKRNSYTVAYFNRATESTEYGQIMLFIHAAEPVALVKKFSVHNTMHHFRLTFDSLNSRLSPVSPTDQEVIIPVKNIIEKCIMIQIENMHYISRYNQLLYD